MLMEGNRVVPDSRKGFVRIGRVWVITEIVSVNFVLVFMFIFWVFSVNFSKLPMFGFDLLHIIIVEFTCFYWNCLSLIGRRRANPLSVAGSIGECCWRCMLFHVFIRTTETWRLFFSVYHLSWFCYIWYYYSYLLSFSCNLFLNISCMQDQIVFPDEAFFEKVQLFWSCLPIVVKKIFFFICSVDSWFICFVQVNQSSGRVYILKFHTDDRKFFFWMQVRCKVSLGHMQMVWDANTVLLLLVLGNQIWKWYTDMYLRQFVPESSSRYSNTHLQSG